ncbi:MAG TPA: aminotransferase class V-fold PLP-dependent enzyme [Sphingorhabdus sp.]|jgi:cysteine desulfurase|nr:aminotransferase class V-fold PLP-dependent enzyme [Sphingorhabdus sp.]
MDFMAQGPRIYLDHAATTPMRPEAELAMREGFAFWANPSSPHAEGRKARAALEDARARIKTAFNWEGELIFTSGASEALAIGLARAKANRRMVSAVEHDAVFRAAPDAQVLPIGTDWTIDRNMLSDALASGPKAAVAIQHVNSETGAKQPVSDLSAQVREAGGLLISDCSQSAGKFDLPDADMIVVSAHKLGGPVGIGALLVRDFEMLEPTGGQEQGYRAGTENLPATLAFAAAVEARGIATQTVGEGMNSQSIAGEAEWLMTAGYAFVDIEYEVNRHGGIFQMSPSQWSDYSILSITMPGVSASAQLIRFDAAGFAVSAGSACSSGTLKPSRALMAFGVGEADARNTIRMSAGWNTKFEEIMSFVKLWQQIAAGVARA